jgi:hypothetical protein
MKLPDKCIKCGMINEFPRPGFKIEYVPYSVVFLQDPEDPYYTGMNQKVEKEEHLKVTCKQCGYSFDTDCEDKNDN